MTKLRIIICLNLLVLLLIGVIYTQILDQSPTPVQAQTPPASGNNALCSAVGNNLAIQFESGLQGIDEGNYTLALLDTGRDIAPIIQAINGYSGTVIVRVGASNTSLGPPAGVYRQMLIDIAQATNKPFIAMATHNEPNGAENSPIEEEVNFGKTVTTGFPHLDKVTFISGQLDNYYNSNATLDQSRANLYIQAYRAIPNLKGISLPLYTTPNFPTGEAAFLLYQKYVGIARANGFNDIYITESGPFADYSVGFESTYDEYLIAVQKALSYTPTPKALLMFNARGYNRDSIFKYTAPFWSSACREAMRTRCFDTEHVLSVCIDGIVEGDHLCREYCSGTPTDPCRFTPQKDCSYPIDMPKFISPDATPEEKDLAIKYLQDYLPNIVPFKGLVYRLSGFVKDYNICARDDAVAQALCAQQQGGGGVTIDVQQSNDNTFNPPEDQSGANIRMNHSRGTLSNPCADRKENYGPALVQTDLDTWIKRTTSIIALKEACWNAGTEPLPHSRTVDGIDHPVRCMNYQEWPGMGNEQQLFQGGPLSSCAQVYGSPNQEEAIARCKADLKNLQDTNPPLFDQVWCSSDIHIATYPIFGGIDVFPTNNEDFFYRDNPASEDLDAAIKSDKGILFSDNGEAEEDIYLDLPGILGTAYYVRAMTGGIDAFEASQIVKQNAFTHPHMNPPTTPGFPIGNLFQLLLDAIKGFLANIVSNINNIRAFHGDPHPFYYRRIPPEFRFNSETGAENDARFYALQYAFYKTFSECKAVSGEIQVDKSLNDRTLPQAGTNGNFTYAVRTAANLVNLVKKLLSGELIDGPDSFRTIDYVVCEIAPKFLLDADENATEVTQAFTPYSLRDRFEKLGNRVFLPTQEITAGGSVTTATVIETGTRAFNPPGCGDNVNATNPNGISEDAKLTVTCPMGNNPYGITFKPPYLPPEFCGPDEAGNLHDCYCGYAGYPPCPDPRAQLELIEYHDGREGYEREILKYGGETATKLTGRISMQALLPKDQAFKDYTEDDYYYLCNLASSPDCVDPVAPDTGTGGVCSGFSGGFPIASNKFKEVIASAATKFNVPPQLIMAMIYGENCRFTSGGRNVCQQAGDFHFQPGVEYPFSPGCEVPGSGTDAQMNGKYRGMFHVFSFAHHSNGWGANRDPAYTNVCSIHDMTFATAKLLASYNPGVSSPEWTRQQLERAITQWATGRHIPAGCNATLADIPTSPAETWTPAVRSTALGGIRIYCGYIDKLYNESGPDYMDAACN